MEISTANLQAFYALAQERNFSQAARKIAISQPAFSQRIINLERELETTLVIRDKKRIALTPSGEKLLRYCEINRQMEEEFLGDLKHTSIDQLRGELRIGGFSSVMRSMLIPALAPLLKSNPELKLQTFTAELRDIIQLLKESRIDFALHNSPAPQDSMKSLLLGYEENVLVSSRKHPKSRLYLDHDESDPVTAAYLKLTKTAPADIQKHYLDDVYGLLDGVKLGLGRAVLPMHLIDDKALKIENPSVVLRVPVFLIYRGGAYYTRLQQATIETIASYFGKKLRTTKASQMSGRK